jgi:hypothetical protein
MRWPCEGSLKPKATTPPPRAPSMSEQRDNRPPPRQSPPPQAAKSVRSFKGWFWLSYTPWLVLWLATDFNKAWDAAGIPVIFFLLGIPVSFLIAANRTKLWSSGAWKPHVRVGAITAFAAIAFILVCVLVDKTTSSHPLPSKTQVQQPSVPWSTEAKLPVPRIAAVGKLTAIYKHPNLSIRYPSNWTTKHDSGNTVIFPNGSELGILNGRGPYFSHAIFIQEFSPSQNNLPFDFYAATQECIRAMIQANPGAKVVKSGTEFEIHGHRAVSTHVVNPDSPIGEEHLGIITVDQGNFLSSVTMTVPARDLELYTPVIEALLASITPTSKIQRP